MAKNSGADQMNARQHYRMARGDDIGAEHDRGGAKGSPKFKDGGQVAHKPDTTSFQSYGNGFRKKK